MFSIISDRTRIDKSCLCTRQTRRRLKLVNISIAVSQSVFQDGLFKISLFQFSLSIRRVLSFSITSSYDQIKNNATNWLNLFHNERSRGTNIWVTTSNILVTNPGMNHQPDSLNVKCSRNFILIQIKKNWKSKYYYILKTLYFELARKASIIFQSPYYLTTIK